MLLSWVLVKSLLVVTQEWYSSSRLSFCSKTWFHQYVKLPLHCTAFHSTYASTAVIALVFKCFQSEAAIFSKAINQTNKNQWISDFTVHTAVFNDLAANKPLGCFDLGFSVVHHVCYLLWAGWRVNITDLIIKDIHKFQCFTVII